MIRYFRIILFVVLAILMVILIFNAKSIYRKIFPAEKTNSQIILKPEFTVKTLEGWTLNNINNYLTTIGSWGLEDLEKVTGQAKIDYRNRSDLVLPPDYVEQFSFLQDKPKYYGLEGFLFPDTYRVFTDASAQDVIIKMLDNFDKKLTAEMRAEIARQGKTIYEIVIMASLIEKEAPIDYNDPDNRNAKIVSDIFWGRLKTNQALQSDATLSYLLNDSNPAHSGEDLKIDSPYNSYKYRGLPPTPICNPGIKAIEAAIYPIKTDYNYFLTSLDGKNIYYAKTYQEHLQNKYKYLK